MIDWDERYRKGEHTNDEPHPLVVEFTSKLKPGRALDVACGAGRHAIWLAERGWQVTAVDSSRVAIEILQQRASEKDLAIDSRIADLERHEFIIEPESYDLIVVCNYLQRDLFPAIKAGLRVGGLEHRSSIAAVPPDVRKWLCPSEQSDCFLPGYARKDHGHSPEEEESAIPDRSQTYRTSGGIAAEEYLTGALVIAVIAMIDDDPQIKPMNPAFLLKPGELSAEFEGWELLRDFEGKRAGDEHRRAAAEIVARRLR